MSKEQIEALRDSDERVKAALWEENHRESYVRFETVVERAEFAERIREEG